MAEDRKDKPASGETAPPASAIPNRDRRREPPVIDARPGDVKEVTPAAEKQSAPPEPAPGAKPDAEKKPDAAPARAATESEPSKTGSTAAARPVSAAPGASMPSASSASPKPDSSGARNAPPPSRRSRGFLAGLLGGVAGAAIVLAGGYALMGSKFYSAQQVDALLAATGGKTAGDLNAALAAAQKKADEDAARRAAAIDDLAKRIAIAEGQAKKLLGDVDALRAAKPPPALSATVDLSPIEAGLGDLEKRIAAIETTLSAPKTPLRPADPDVKLSEGPSTPAPAAPNLPPPGLVADVSALAERLRALETRPAPRLPDLAPSLAPLQIRLQQLEQRLAPLAEKLGPLETAISQNRETAGAQAKSLATQRERADAAALAVVARALADAADAGAPYAHLLKAAQALGAEPEAVKALEPFAAQGVSTAAGLTSQFGPLGAALIEGEAKPPPNASLTEKLAASAGKLVRVRPAEDTTDETPAALATRIGVALRARKFDEALALYDKLPETARARAKAWADSLRARVEAARASERILSAALMRLARP